jgi:hypothetical protein
VDIDSIAATIRLLEDIFVKGMSHITFHVGTSNKLWLVDTDSIAPTIRLLEDIIVKRACKLVHMPLILCS